MIERSLIKSSSGSSVPEQLLTLSDEQWLLRRKGFRNTRKSIQVNETLLTVGNGYLNIRGSLEELPPEHSGGMYLNGIYDKSEAAVEELVKCPMWSGWCGRRPAGR